MVACVRVVGSQYPWSFLQGSLIFWSNFVSSFKSRVNCFFFFKLYFPIKKHYFLISFIFCVCFIV